MPPRTPRHLAEHPLPWRLMLVAFGLTFAVVAALAASAALVPEQPVVPSAVTGIPAEEAGPSFATDPPAVAPSTAGAGQSSTTTTTTPQEPPPGVAPVLLAAQPPATPAPRATPPTPGPSGTPAPPEPTAPSATEPEPAPVNTVEATTTTVEPTTTTLEPTTTTLEPTTTTVAETTTTSAAATTTTVLLVTTTQPTDGVALAPLLLLLYLLRAHLPRPGRHARPGRWHLPQLRSRRATRRPPSRARTRP